MNMQAHRQACTDLARDPRWAAVLARDVDADDRFWYSVRTTGVYCRPSCGARRPRPENVAFHASRADAESAGFRPCQRCKPDQASLREQRAGMIADACRYIERAETEPSLAQLARRTGISAYHFHRLFKATTGLTPKTWAMAHRVQQMRKTLPRTASVTNAIYAAGYNSSGRFYAQSNAMLGMTPSDFRAGGARRVIRFALGECSLGSILVAASERGICAITLGDDPEQLLRLLQDQFANAELIGADGDFQRVVAQVVGFVDAPAYGLDLPLDVRGTAFQHRVWRALREIPAGSTASYSAIAIRIGQPKAVRAVAGACASNPIAVAIPCHRVVRNNGAISGYRWGIERKRILLEKEADA